MRCLGIDFGTRRVGLAFGDELGVATPLAALVEAEADDRWASLTKVVAERRITEIALGHPLNMDGSIGFKAKEVELFAKKLKDAFGLPVYLIDERLTSYEAESSIPKSKRRELRGSGLVDSRSATLILQDHLNTRIPPLMEEEP